jgi:hypothetical protein
MRRPIEQVIQQLLRPRHEQIDLVHDEHGDAPVAAFAVAESLGEDVARAVRREPLADELLGDGAVRVRGRLRAIPYKNSSPVS